MDRYFLIYKTNSESLKMFYIMNIIKTLKTRANVKDFSQHAICFFLPKKIMTQNFHHHQTNSNLFITGLYSSKLSTSL